MKGEYNCYICGRKHDKTFFFRFPKNFPNEWKWCCRCLSIAEFVVKHGISEVIKIYDDYQTKDYQERTILIAKKINKLITLE